MPGLTPGDVITSRNLFFYIEEWMRSFREGSETIAEVIIRVTDLNYTTQGFYGDDFVGLVIESGDNPRCSLQYWARVLLFVGEPHSPVMTWTLIHDSNDIQRVV